MLAEKPSADSDAQVPKKFAFILNEYRPYGGMPRDCVSLAAEASSRGHEVTIVTRTWQGEKPALPGVQVVELGRHGWTNQQRDRSFVHGAQAWLNEHESHVTVGFMKMPGLDWHFAADPCYEAKVQRLKPRWFRLTPRYRRFARAERAVFEKGMGTQIMLLHPGEVGVYEKLYGTESERLRVLPPGIQRVNVSDASRAQARTVIRKEFQLGEETAVVLFVGSGFRTKGLDRALQAVAAQSLPCQFLIAGQDKAAPFELQARGLGISDQVHFLGGRPDIDQLMHAADVLIHPAYSENTGTVLIEALIRGLPVITTSVCGFAYHVTEAQGGDVIEEPFEQAKLDETLHQWLTTEQKSGGITYGMTHDLYSCHAQAVTLLEQL